MKRIIAASALCAGLVFPASAGATRGWITIPRAKHEIRQYLYWRYGREEIHVRFVGDCEHEAPWLVWCWAEGETPGEYYGYGSWLWVERVTADLIEVGEGE